MTLTVAKLLVLLVIMMLQTATVIYAQPFSPCANEEDAYNNCLDANLGLCEEGGCQEPSFVAELQSLTDDVMCALWKGNFCLVHYCCQGICKRETKTYFGCLTQNMEHCDLLCLNDDPIRSAAPSGISIQHLWLLAVAVIAFNI